ncbi:hypothetical protein BURK1_02370 [Burkholderiales bacterium]|nr:hypothetical protein BURK1_02370 [Burkholderiales bacterium]
MIKPAVLLAAAFAFALPPNSHAQTPQTVPPHKCEKPEFPGRVSPQAKLQRWTSDFRAYLECVKAYVNERNAAIDAQSKAAKIAVDEFNAGVTEYNETVKTFAN